MNFRLALTSPANDISKPHYVDGTRGREGKAKKSFLILRHCRHNFPSTRSLSSTKAPRNCFLIKNFTTEEISAHGWGRKKVFSFSLALLLPSAFLVVYVQAELMKLFSEWNLTRNFRFWSEKESSSICDESLIASQSNKTRKIRKKFNKLRQVNFINLIFWLN